MCEFWKPILQTHLGGSAAGRELRWLLLGLLIATLIFEQLLALRLSYHPEPAG